jgi:putative SOS response-associated peptidase YedK
VCGRFSQTKSKQDIKTRFNVKKVADEVLPVFNIAPDSYVPVILNESSDEVTLARWGLVPSWSKEEKSAYSMINARAETLQEKPSYKRLIKSKRCLIIADSFYEWKKQEGKKIPHRIMLKDDGLFAFAGLWDMWEKDGRKLYSCTIITTTPNKLVSSIHDRMPVILDKDKELVWLKEENLDRALQLLKPCLARGIKCFSISTEINNPRNNSAEVCKEC